MKKYLLSLFFTLAFAMNLHADDFRFNGISMGSNETTFISSMESRGFVQLEKTKTYYRFAGKYNDRECDEIYVIMTPLSRRVYSVFVYYPEHTTWFDLNKEYQRYKTAYDNVFPISKQTHSFDAPYRLGDGNEFTAVKENKCHYFSTYSGGSLGDYKLTVQISQQGRVEFLVTNMLFSDLYKVECDRLGI